jgi:hypothetical protein
MPLGYQAEATSQGSAVDRNHNRLERLGAQREKLFMHLKSRFHRRGLRQIHTRAKNAAGGTDENTSDIATRLRGTNGFHNLRAHFKREGVALVGTIESEMPDSLAIV